LAFRRNFNPGVTVTWIPRIWHPKSSPRRDWCCFSAQQMPHKAKSILCGGETGMVRSCACVEKRHDAARNRASTPPQARVTPSVLRANSERGKKKRKEKRAAAPGILAGGAGPRSNCTRTLVQRLPCPSLLLRPIQSAYI